MAINLTNLTRWDILDKKTSDVFKECRGGVLQKEQRKELANHITRPTYFLCRLYQMLQESNKLNTEQKRVCKYLLLYPHKSQLYGTNTAGKPKPDFIGFAMAGSNGSTGLLLECMLSMKEIANAYETGEGSLLRSIYGKGNPNDYRLSLSDQTTRHLCKQNTMQVIDEPDMVQILRYLNPRMFSVQEEETVVESNEVTGMEHVTTPLHEWEILQYEQAREHIDDGMYLTERRIMHRVVPLVLEDYSKALSKENYMEFRKLSLSFEYRLDDDENLQGADQGAAEEQDQAQVAAEVQKTAYDRKMEVAKQMEATEWKQEIADMRVGFRMKHHFDLTPKIASVYSPNTAETWEEVNYADFMLFLHVFYLKVTKKGIYGDNGSAEEQTSKGSDVNSNDNAKCHQKVLDNWIKSREKVSELNRANVSRILSSDIYSWRISFGDILGKRTSAYRAMHKAYYKMHNEALGHEVNNFDRDVSDVAWADGVQSYLFALGMDQYLLEEFSAVLEVVKEQNQLALDQLLQCITESADVYRRKLIHHPYNFFGGSLTAIETLLFGIMSLEETDLEEETIRAAIVKEADKHYPLVVKVSHRNDPQSTCWTVSRDTLDKMYDWRLNTLAVGTLITYTDILGILTETHQVLKSEKKKTKVSLDRKGIASTSLVNGSNDKEAIDSSTSTEMTGIFRQFNMKFSDLSFHSYMQNMTNLMKKHFHKEYMFQIEEIRAEEAHNTMIAVETFMRSLHYYPQPVTSDGAKGSNTSQTPVIQSAMSAKADKGKLAKDVVTQEVVDNLAKALNTETVCVLAMFDIGCNGGCGRSHNHLDTELFFAIEKYFKFATGSRRDVSEAKKLWMQSKSLNRRFVKRADVYQKMADCKLIDHKADQKAGDAKKSGEGKKSGPRKPGGNSNDDTTNRGTIDTKRREIIWDGDGKKKFTVGQAQAERYCKNWCGTLQALEKGATNFVQNGHGPLTLEGEKNACARTFQGKPFDNCGLDTCVMVQLLQRGNGVDAWMDKEFKRKGLSCTAQKLRSLLKDGKIDWRNYAQQSTVNRAAEEKTDNNTNSESNTQLLDRVTQLESAVSVFSAGDSSVIHSGDSPWSMAESWSPVYSQSSVGGSDMSSVDQSSSSVMSVGNGVRAARPDGSFGGSDMSIGDQFPSSVMSVGNGVRTARAFGAGRARQYGNGASEPDNGHVVISDQQARHYEKLRAMERERWFQEAMAHERMLMGLPSIPPTTQRQPRPPPGRGGGRAGGRGGTH